MQRPNCTETFCKYQTLQNECLATTEEEKGCPASRQPARTECPICAALGSAAAFDEATAYKWVGQAIRNCKDAYTGQTCADRIASALLEAYKLGQQSKR